MFHLRYLSNNLLARALIFGLNLSQVKDTYRLWSVFSIGDRWCDMICVQYRWTRPSKLPGCTLYILRKTGHKKVRSPCVKASQNIDPSSWRRKLTWSLIVEKWMKVFLSCWILVKIWANKSSALRGPSDWIWFVTPAFPFLYVCVQYLLNLRLFFTFNTYW